MPPLSDEDEVILHLQDTLVAGDGLCRPEAVKTLEEEGPERIEEVIAWGKQLDRHGTKLTFETEASYSHSHVLRAADDSTGGEILRALQAKVRRVQKHFGAGVRVFHRACKRSQE